MRSTEKKSLICYDGLVEKYPMKNIFLAFLKVNLSILNLLLHV